MSRKQMQPPTTNRQESHRVYLQQYTQPNNATKDVYLKTNSTAIRFTSITNSKDVCYLLRQKFGLPSLPEPPSSQVSNLSSISSSGHSSSNNSFSEMKSVSQQPLVHRIHARLNQVRQQQQQQKTNDNNNSNPMNKSSSSDNNNEEVRRKQRRQRRRQRRKRLLECQLNEDVLVMVATCYVPKTYVQFEHEEYCIPSAISTPQEVKSSTSSDSTAVNKKQAESNNNISYQVEPLNIFETLLPTENPLHRMDELLSYTDNVQDKAEIEVFGKKKTSKKMRKTPLIHWFFIPKKSNQVPKAGINIDGYCTEAFDDSDYEDIHEDSASKSGEGKTELAENAQSWKNEIIDYAISNHSTRNVRESKLEQERHRFTILSTFESVNGSDNTSGYLLKQSGKDKSVWKKVHCVLTENQFWFVSRVKKFGKDNSTRIGQHGIIDLNGTLLLESMLDTPLSGLPNTFQLTTAEGHVHIFQAGNKSAYQKWSQCLSDRIVLCQENTSFNITDYIVSNEVQFRQRRNEEYLYPSLERMPHKMMLNSQSKRKQINSLMSIGIQITTYKEHCRRVQYVHSRSMLSANEVTKNSPTHSKRVIEKPLWLTQSLDNLTFAELLLTHCKDFLISFKESQVNDEKDNVYLRSEKAEEEIYQCLNNLRQRNEQYLLDYHKMTDVSKDNENSNQNATILLPEALFDEMFSLFSEIVASQY